MFNLGIAISFAVVLLTGVSCYDFDNSEYNRILAEELEELHEYEGPSSIHVRTRRDEEAASAASRVKDKCKRHRFRGCCADDTMEALHEDDMQIKKDCYKEVTGHERPHQSMKYDLYFNDHFRCDKVKMDKHKKEMTCVFQCVGQKRKVVDASGKIVEAEFKKILKEKFSKFEAEAWLLPKLDNIAEKCYKEAMAASSKQENVDKVHCDPSTIKASFCLWREIQMACPTTKIKDEKYCSKLRERMKTQPENPFRPSMMMLGDFE